MQARVWASSHVQAYANAQQQVVVRVGVLRCAVSHHVTCRNSPKRSNGAHRRTKTHNICKVRKGSETRVEGRKRCVKAEKIAQKC